MVRRADGGDIGRLPHDFAAVAYLGATHLLVCVRHRHFLRLQHLQFQTRSEKDRRRDRLVTCAEGCRGHLDRIWLTRLYPVAGDLSDGIHSRTPWHCHWPSGICARVEFGRAVEPGGPGFRPYACTSLEDGITGDRGEIEEHEKRAHDPGFAWNPRTGLVT